MKLFESGEIIVSKGVGELIENCQDFRDYIQLIMGWYAAGNWGNVSRDIVDYNNKSILGEGPICGDYICDLPWPGVFKGEEAVAKESRTRVNVRIVTKFGRGKTFIFLKNETDKMRPLLGQLPTLVEKKWGLSE